VQPGPCSPGPCSPVSQSIPLWREPHITPKTSPLVLKENTPVPVGFNTWSLKHDIHSYGEHLQTTGRGRGGRKRRRRSRKKRTGRRRKKKRSKRRRNRKKRRNGRRRKKKRRKRRKRKGRRRKKRRSPVLLSLAPS